VHDNLLDQRASMDPHAGQIPDTGPLLALPVEALGLALGLA
jgi:hypothetical protein